MEIHNSSNCLTFAGLSVKLCKNDVLCLFNVPTLRNISYKKDVSVAQLGDKITMKISSRQLHVQS